MPDEKVEESQVTANDRKISRCPWLTPGILCLVFFIFVLIAAAGYGYWYLATVATQSQNQFQQLQSDVNALKTETNSAQQAVQQSIDDIKNLKQTVSDLSQEKQNTQEKWLLAEARYYAKLANDTLQFARNIPLAIVLLKMADQEISHLSDPKMTEVRKVIATDIANLEAAPQIDVAGLYMKLTALNTALDQLPLQVNQINLQEQKITAPAVQNQSIWQRGLHTVWQALQSLVVIRHHTNGLMPLVTEEQQALLYQNLHAILAQSIWALLNGQPEIYQSSLQQLMIWVKRSFVLDAPITRAYLNDLTQLEKIDIHPAVPAMMNTLQALNGV